MPPTASARRRRVAIPSRPAPIRKSRAFAAGATVRRRNGSPRSTRHRARRGKVRGSSRGTGTSRRRDRLRRTDVRRRRNGPSAIRPNGFGPAARVLIHDVKQRWASPKASPGFRRAASPAARCVAFLGIGEHLRSRTLRHRRRRFVDLRSDGRAAMARPGRSTEASFTAGRLFSMAILELESRTPSIAAKSFPRWPRARLQRETLSDWRTMFSKKSIIARAVSPSRVGVTLLRWLPDRPSRRLAAVPPSPPIASGLVPNRGGGSSLHSGAAEDAPGRSTVPGLNV